MEEIKVGEYVRTDRGVIYEYTEEEKNDIMMQDFRLCNDGKIVKHGRIIDLIEEGDYVNGFKITKKAFKILYTDSIMEIEMYNSFMPNGGIHYQNVMFFEEDIKTIVTKEMFNQVKYEV